MKYNPKFRFLSIILVLAVFFTTFLPTNSGCFAEADPSDTYASDILDLQEGLITLHKLYNQLKQKIEEKDKEIDKLKRDLDINKELQNERRMIESRENLDFKVEVKSLASGLQQKVAEQQKKIDSLQVENGNLKKEIETYKQKVTDQQQKISSFNQELSALKQKDGEQQKKIDGLQAENVNLKKEIANSNQSITSSKNALNVFDKKLTEQQSKYSQENAGLRQEISALKQKVGKHQKKIDSLRAKNGNRKKEIVTLNQRDAGNQAKIAEPQKANSVSKQEIESLKQKSAKYGDILENTASGYHNSIFRGKDVTRYYNDGSLYTRISSGKFEDLFVGDYIVKNGVTWRIAGFDIILNKGATVTTKHHACIVPDTKLAKARMNSTDTTADGYVGSEMHKTTLNNVFSNSIKPVFGDHVITYSALLTKGIDSKLINRWGTAYILRGGSDSCSWFDRKFDLMNENQVYGSIVWSSTGYETGSDNVQLPLFRLAPEFINKERYWYWLRNITSDATFAYVSDYGHSGNCCASNTSGGVRPCFYID